MYHLIETTPDTIEFIDKYLSEDETVIPSHRSPEVIIRRWEEINKDFKLCNADDINYYINTYYPSWNNTKYNDKFLKTYYWVIIADVVKLRANFLCQLNFFHNGDRLNTHHGGYNIHGKELQNINLLISLCEECHTNFHLNIPIKVEVPPIMIEATPVVSKNEKIKIKSTVFNTSHITEKQVSNQLSILHELLNKKIKKKV
jgi:hypothetical protein